MLTSEQKAEIRACRGVYRPVDVAKHYDVHPSTVIRTWRAGGVTAEEPPNINTRFRVVDNIEDIRLLLDRGISIPEVAKQLGVSEQSIYQVRGVFV